MAGGIIMRITMTARLMVTGGVPPEVKLGDVHLGVLGPRVRLFQPDVQLLDLVLKFAGDAGDADTDDVDADAVD